MILLQALGRLIAVVIGLAAAVLAGVAIIALSLYQIAEMARTYPDPVGEVADLFAIGIVGTMFVGSFSMAPALIGAVVAEFFRLRSWIYHGTVGALGGALAYVSLEEMALRRADAASTAWEMAIFLAAGLGGGLVYWLIAGRRAGIALLDAR